MNSSEKLQPYQIECINLLLSSEALLFGEFTLKSGRKAPYFLNTGRFYQGDQIAALGRQYAAHIVRHDLSDVDVIFGPAYKGIPLAVSTVIALTEQHQCQVGYACDRKEIKDHGDTGGLMGRKLQDGDRVVIVEDVITAGTTFRKVVPQLQAAAKVEITGIVLCLDRCEKGAGELSAVQEIQESFGIPVFPILTVYQLVEHLTETSPAGATFNEEAQQRIAAYLEEYGA